MKKLLLATLLLALSTPGLAGGLDASEQRAVAPKKAATVKTTGYNLMHPFWGPAQGQFASDTNYKFTRTNYQYGSGVNNYAQAVAEKISFGLTDNWTLFGAIAKNWSKWGNWGVRAHDKGDAWLLGTSYNFINDGKTFLQGALSYWQGKTDNPLYYDYDGAYKGYSAQATYGYNFDAVTPYITLGYDNYLNAGRDNDGEYTVAIAAYKQLTDKVGSNLGVKYAHQTHGTGIDYNEGVNNAYTLTADTSYMLTKNVALKVYGEYLLHEDAKSPTEAQNRYTVGANLKVAF